MLSKLNMPRIVQSQMKRKLMLAILLASSFVLGRWKRINCMRAKRTKHAAGIVTKTLILARTMYRTDE